MNDGINVTVSRDPSSRWAIFSDRLNFGVVLLLLLSTELLCAQGNLLDHFVWSSVPSSVAVGQTFTAVLQARTPSDSIATNFNGQLLLTAQVPSQAPRVLITEVQSSVVRRVELSNVSTNPVDISGWQVVLYDSQSWPLPKQIFTIPAGTVCPKSEVFQISDNGTWPGLFPAFYTILGLAWNPSFPPNGPAAVLLLDSAGRPIDFFCAGDAYPGLVGVPIAIGTALWSGAPVPVIPIPTLTYQRVGHVNHHNAADWAALTSNVGIRNPGLQTNFSEPPASWSLTPSSVSLTNGIASVQVAVPVAGTNVVLRADDGQGHSGQTLPMIVTGLPSLQVSLPPAAYKSAPGLVGQGSVAIPQPLTTNLLVALDSKSPNLIVVPTSVTIPAGSLSKTFAVSNLNDGLVEGPLPVTVSAVAQGFGQGQASITNYDAQPVVLSVVLPNYVMEGSAWVTGSQVRSAVPVAADVVVRLSSSDTNEIRVPDFVIIHAGQSSASFGLAAIANPMLDGNQTVTISASVDGWNPGTAQVLVIENKSATLSISLPYDLILVEGSGVATNVGMVRIPGLLTSNLTVVLNSDAPTRAQVPTNVVIPAGQTSVSFNITALDDTLTNGDVFVHIGANANGFQGSIGGFSLFDNDVASFAFAPLPSAQIGGNPFTVTVSAVNSVGTPCPGYSSVVNLRAQTASGSVAILPNQIGPFTNGVWSGTVTVAGENRGVTLVASDGSGHIGSSNPFDVVAGQSLNLPVSDMAFDPLRRRLWVAVQSGAGASSQNVLSIDPTTGVQDASIPLLGEPGKVAISDDGQFLYVGLTSSNGVVRVNLASRSVDLRFPLIPDGTTVASEMAVPPGDPHALVLQMAGYSAATAIYRDGVLLTNMVPPAYNVNEYHFAFYGSATNFYCIYPGGVRWLNLNDTGVVRVREVQDPQYGGAFVHSGGLFFNSRGAVYEPMSFERLASYPTNGLVAVNANANQVLFLSGARLNAYDLASFAAAGFLDLPIGDGTANRMLLCGSNILAVATATSNLLLVDTALIRQTPTVSLTLGQKTSSPAATVGSNFTYTLTLSNASPAASTNAWVIDVLPADTTLVSVSASGGSWQTTNRLLTFNPGKLNAGSVATLQFSVLPSSPGQMINSAWIVGDGKGATNLSQVASPAVFGPVLPAVTRLRANSDALAYDSARNLLWTTTERFNGALDNSFRSFSLSNGLAGPTVSLGYPSGKIALSADQNYLYAAYQKSDQVIYNWNNYIARANLVNNVVDENFPVVDMYGQQHSVADMIGISSYPSGLIVARQGIQSDIALYKDGAAIVRAPTGTGVGRLQGNSSLPTRFYRMGGDYPGGNVAKLDISSNSINVVGSSILFPLASNIRFGSGLLFADNGLVGDPEALTNVATLPAAGLVETDPVSGQVFYLASTDASQWTLIAFDIHTFAPLWNFNVPGVSGTPADLVRCGPGLLAFRTTDDQLFVLNTAQMAHALAADLILTQDPTPAALITNQQVTFTSRVTNAGPGPATAVFLTNQLPLDVTISSLSSSQGSCSNSGGTIICKLGNLAPGSSAWMQVAATFTRAGTLTNVATVVSSTPDPFLTNNITLTTVDYSVVPVSDLIVTHLPPLSGSNLVCTVVVSNAGPDTASDVVLNDGIGLGGNLLSVTPSQGSVSIFGNSFSASLGELTNGATASLSLAIGSCCGGMVFNQAQAGTTSQDPNLNNNLSASVFSLTGSQFAEEIPVPAIDIAYDLTRQKIVAALSQPLGSVTRSVMGIDARNQAIDTVVNVGNDLRRIAISDDGAFLYVGLADTGGVARVNMSTKAVDLRFPLNTADAPFGPYMAEDLAVMPGSPTTLAAARGGYAGYYSAIAIFDSGVQRPDTIEQGPGAGGYSIQFLDATNLGSMTAWDFQLSTLTSTGLTNPVPVMGGYGGGVFAAEGGLVFTSLGTVLDPLSGTLVGNYPTTGLVAPDLANGRVYFLTYNLILRAFNSTTQTQMWSVDLSWLSGSPQHLIRLGTNGLAFTTDANRMFIVKPSALDTPIADVSLNQSLSPDPVSAGTPLTCTLTVANYGPWTATGVVVSNRIPANAAFLSANSSQGSCGLTNGAVVCALGSLTNGAVATVTINLKAVAPGFITNSAVVTENEKDPGLTNNFTSASVSVISQPSLTVQDATVIQGLTKTTISFPVTVSGPSSAAVSFAYQTADGTAVAGKDYDAASGVFSLPAGATSGSLKLNIIRNDPAIQPLETFYLVLSSVTNASLTRTQVTGTIVVRNYRNVAISSTNVVAGASGVTNALFLLTLNQTSSAPVTVEFQTLDGTATAGFDYQAKSGTLIFAPGVTNLMLAVPVFGGPLWQPNKTFSVVLFEPQNAILSVDEAVGTILSSQPVPPLAIISPPLSQVVSPGATAVFTVQATGNPLPLSYQWQCYGTNLAGATASSLVLPNVQPINSGNYGVFVMNSGGASTNVSATLLVLEGLSYTMIGNNLVLAWSGPYLLQSATNAAGPYFDVPNATSPATNWIGSGPERFFRLRSGL